MKKRNSIPWKVLLVPISVSFVIGFVTGLIAVLRREMSASLAVIGIGGGWLIGSLLAVTLKLLADRKNRLKADKADSQPMTAEETAHN